MIEIALAHQVIKSVPRGIGPKSTYAVSPKQLAAYLKRREAWISVHCVDDELCYELDKPNLLVTFDDGFRDNLTNGLPVLEAHGIPAIIFVVTGFIDGKAYPYELELAEAISNRKALRFPGQDRRVPLKTREDNEQWYQQSRMPLKWVSHTQREDFMERLATLNCYERRTMQTEQFLSWDDVRELDRHPLITVGAHTCRHVVLTKQSLREAYREISVSKRCLEAQLGRAVHHFSYPYGANNVFVRHMVRWAGFRYAFTTRTARARGLTFYNRFSIPRLDLSQ